MKSLKVLLPSLCALLFTAGEVQARDTALFLPVSEAMSTEDAKKKLSGAVDFHFASAPDYEKSFERYTINEKTSGFGRSDEKACKHVFLSAMIALEKRARELGADAVVDIQSMYEGKPYVNAEKYECHAGTFQVKVSLQGRMVVLKEDTQAAE